MSLDRYAQHTSTLMKFKAKKNVFVLCSAFYIIVRGSNPELFTIEPGVSFISAISPHMNHIHALIKLQIVDLNLRLERTKDACSPELSPGIFENT